MISQLSVRTFPGMYIIDNTRVAILGSGIGTCPNTTAQDITRMRCAADVCSYSNSVTCCLVANTQSHRTRIPPNPDAPSFDRSAVPPQNES